MSIRKYSGTAIDCDLCAATFTDVVDVDLKDLELSALSAGWTISHDGSKHGCPKCVKERAIHLDGVADKRKAVK